MYVPVSKRGNKLSTYRDVKKLVHIVGCLEKSTLLYKCNLFDNAAIKQLPCIVFKYQIACQHPRTNIALSKISKMDRFSKRSCWKTARGRNYRVTNCVFM